LAHDIEVAVHRVGKRYDCVGNALDRHGTGLLSNPERMHRPQPTLCSARDENRNMLGSHWRRNTEHTPSLDAIEVGPALVSSYLRPTPLQQVSRSPRVNPTIHKRLIRRRHFRLQREQLVLVQRHAQLTRSECRDCPIVSHAFPSAGGQEVGVTDAQFACSWRSVPLVGVPSPAPCPVPSHVPCSAALPAKFVCAP
jgi:hypothetical protein